MTEAPTDLGTAFAGFDPVQMQALISAAQLSQQQALNFALRSKRISRRKFRSDEDEILRALVQQYGESDWNAIAQQLPDRTARQCRERWRHYLCPDVITGDWTEEEEELLLAKVQEIGTKWAAIAAFFPHRTDIGVKNHYIRITSKRSKGNGHKLPQRAVLVAPGSPLFGDKPAMATNIPISLDVSDVNSMNTENPSLFANGAIPTGEPMP